MATRKTITRGIVVCILLALLGYIYFEARPFLSGPQLEIVAPSDGFVTAESPLVVSGRARYITKITLNGNPIFIDESGAFQRALPLLPGYQVIEVSVQDRFGRTRTERISGLYTPAIPMPEREPLGTSTPSNDASLDVATTTGEL